MPEKGTGECKREAERENNKRIWLKHILYTMSLVLKFNFYIIL